MSTTNAVETVEYPSARAVARQVSVTPMKARRVVNLVRGKSVDEALSILKFAPQAASEPVAKVVASAAANAQNNLNLDPRTLVISTAFVDEGVTMKRFQPRAQGRAFRIRKRTSHITIVVSSIPGAGGATNAAARAKRVAAAGKKTTKEGAQ